jgi:hypothetical protein
MLDRPIGLDQTAADNGVVDKSLNYRKGTILKLPSGPFFKKLGRRVLHACLPESRHNRRVFV